MKFEALISGQIQLAIEKIQEEIQNRGAADVFKWWLFMATDIIGELSFGESFHMLETGKVKAIAIGLAFESKCFY